MDLYYGRMSGNSARSIFALFEVGAPFELRLVDPRKKENRTPEYLAVNPMGKIPALADGAFHLWESNAINWYAAEKHPESGLLPATPAGRAAVQRWMFFQAAHVTPSCFQIMRTEHRRLQEHWNLKGDPAAAQAARTELARWLPVLEGALAGKEWLEGPFSLADVAYAPHLALIVEAGFSMEPHPAVRAWLDRLLARPAWKKTAELVFQG
jgi:glutathione S-transferase